MTKREMMIKAHNMAKKMVGDYSARLAIALRYLWALAKEAGKKMAEKIRLVNVKHRSSGNVWCNTICSATIVDGVMTLTVARPDDYRQENNNTTYGYYDVDCAVYTDGRDVKSHGVDWDLVTKVVGKTFEVKAIINKYGFKWSGAAKCWVK